MRGGRRWSKTPTMPQLPPIGGWPLEGAHAKPPSLWRSATAAVATIGSIGGLARVCAGPGLRSASRLCGFRGDAPSRSATRSSRAALGSYMANRGIPSRGQPRRSPTRACRVSGRASALLRRAPRRSAPQSAGDAHSRTDRSTRPPRPLRIALLIRALARSLTVGILHARSHRLSRGGDAHVQKTARPRNALASPSITVRAASIEFGLLRSLPTARAR